MAQHSAIIKEIGKDLGFTQVGISKVRRLDEEENKLAAWLTQHHHGTMDWMANHFEKRLDPAKLVPGARSVVSLLYNYHCENVQPDDAPKVATYAYGRDYHKVIRNKLKEYIGRIRESIGAVEGRCFVDSAPVMERQWARQSGLGWLGKNTLLIHPRRGSYFFLAELIIDLPLEPDHPIKDHCGTCTACIDACPTDAIDKEGYLLDASKCISYLTIELKDRIPPEFHGKMENWVFGCDICQQVCPWNRFASPHEDEALSAKPALKTMMERDWKEMSEEVFEKAFAGTPLKRAKYQGIRKNLEALNRR